MQENFTLLDMQFCQYFVIPEIGSNIDAIRYPTYGIRLSGPDCEAILHDVSVYKDTVDLMTQLFNDLQLSPCHFRDVVEDLLP